MYQVNNKRLVTFALLLFLSQSVLASVIDCVVGLSSANVEQVQMHHQENADTEHKTHQMPTQAHNMADMKDCCSAGSHCSMASCLFIVLPAMLDLQSHAASYNIDISFYQFFPNGPVSSLYRPPIVA